MQKTIYKVKNAEHAELRTPMFGTKFGTLFINIFNTFQVLPNMPNFILSYAGAGARIHVQYACHAPAGPSKSRAQSSACSAKSTTC